MAKKSVARLILLPAGLTHQYVVPSRPSSRCAICGQRFRDHGESSDWACDCGRCGLQFAFDCYWAHVASARERARSLVWTEDDLEREPYIYLCSGCRS